MAITVRKLFEPTLLTGSAATIFTVDATPSSTVLINGRVRLTNYTAVAITATVHAVPSGGSASDTNAVVKGKSVGANDYLDIDLPQMKAGDFLQALAGAVTSMSIHPISGVLAS